MVIIRQGKVDPVQRWIQRKRKGDKQKGRDKWENGAYKLYVCGAAAFVGRVLLAKMLGLGRPHAVTWGIGEKRE